MHNIITITYNYAQKLYCNKRCKAWKSFQLKLKFNDMEVLLSSFILTKRSKNVMLTQDLHSIKDGIKFLHPSL